MTKPLLEVNDVPAIHYWVRALRDCPRVAPSNRTTHITCNQDNLDEFANWARDPLRSSGFDGRNLINNGVDSTMPRTGAARDLLFAIENALGRGGGRGSSAPPCSRAFSRAHAFHFVVHFISSIRRST